MSDTVPGIGPGGWNKAELAAAQESNARIRQAHDTVLYELYTENKLNTHKIVARYFDGATIVFASGLWQGDLEHSVIVRIIGTRADMQRVFDLAGDIRVTNNQTSVLVTWQPISRFDITEDAINDSHSAT